MTIADRDSTVYSTTNTALAAYLHCEGFELINVDTSHFPSVFTFKNNNSNLQDLIHAFQIGKAKGNIVLFFRSYKQMLSEIKDNRRRNSF